MRLAHSTLRRWLRRGRCCPLSQCCHDDHVLGHRPAWKALVERRRPEDNRRAVALTATDQGRQVVEGHIASYRDACRVMLRSLEPAEQSELTRLTECAQASL